MMRFRIRALNAWGVLAVATGCGALAGHAGADLPIRIAAGAGLAGHGAPGVPGAAISVIGAAQIADDGTTLATCRVAGPGLVYAVNDLVLVSFDRYGNGRLLGRTGVANATGVDGTTFSATFFPRLGKDAGVAAVGFLSGAGVDPSNSTGYWRGDRQSIGLSLRSGLQAVPDVPGAVFYGFVGGFPCAISRAGVAFNAQLAVGTGGVTIDNYQGIWGPSSGGGVSLVARPGVVGGVGAPPSSLAGAVYLRTNFKSLVLADNGALAFQATLALGTPGVTDANDTLIVERRPGEQATIAAREGMEVPGHPGVFLRSLDTSAFVSAGGLTMNGAGWIAFGDIDGANPPSAGVSRLWRRAPDGRFDLLAARDAAGGPGSPVGMNGTFTTILAPAMNGSGATVFAGQVTSATGVRSAGLWSIDPAGTVSLLGASGLANSPLSPPDSSGAAFSTEPPANGSYRINARGQVLFRWKLENGVGGTTATSDDGLWAWDPAAGLLKVSRTGDQILVGSTPQNVRSINTFLGPGGDDDGRIMDVNELGEAAYVVQFADNTGALLVAQLPGSGACCRGATCAVDSSAACAGPNTRFAGLGTACVIDPHGTCCAADFDHSGTPDTIDIFAFLNAWLSGSISADTNRSGSLDATDILEYLNAWYAGC